MIVIIISAFASPASVVRGPLPIHNILATQLPKLGG
jgi:hypothetical protein